MTISLDGNLFKQALEVSDIQDDAELVNLALEALLEKHGETPIRSSSLVSTGQNDTPAAAATPETSIDSQNESPIPRPPPTGPAARFLGEYLVYAELISQSQLADATAWLETKNVRLGQLAVDEGFMTVTQADSLNKKQRDVDKPFGALAVEHGLLNSEQLQSLLDIQKDKRVDVNDALLELEILEPLALEQAVSAFEKIDHGPKEEPAGHPLLPSDMQGNRMAAMVLDTFPKIANRVAGIQSKVDYGRPVTPKFLWDCTASLVLSDETNLKVYLSVNEDLADTILRRLFGDEMAESEMAPEFDDAIAEFLTTVTAAAVRSLSEEGITVKMNRSEIESEAPPTGFAFPLNSQEGNGSILLVPG